MHYLALPLNSSESSQNFPKILQEPQMASARYLWSHLIENPHTASHQTSKVKLVAISVKRETETPSARLVWRQLARRFPALRCLVFHQDLLQVSKFRRSVQRSPTGAGSAGGAALEFWINLHGCMFVHLRRWPCLQVTCLKRDRGMPTITATAHEP